MNASLTSRFQLWINAGTALAILATAALIHHWHRSVQRSADAVSTELRQLETQWANTAADLDKARLARARFERFADQAARVTRECSQSNWSSALQGIVASCGPHIQLRDIRARRLSADEAGWSLQIAGLSAGTAPRMEADAFRLKMQLELERAFNGIVRTEFQRVDELPNAQPNSGEARATFTIVATIGLVERTKQPAEQGS